MNFTHPTLCILAGCVLAPGASAQIRRDPNGVNVNAQAATSVFITYGNLQGMEPIEAEWCGELIPAAPAVGSRCNPDTLFGRLPARLDRSRLSGQGGFTDIMSIPPSVARRAYQAASSGATSSFYYVRRFVDPQGIRPDEYVFVTCRMTGGGARTPFSLVDVRLSFATDDPVLSVNPGTTPPEVRARITYNGTARLRGRWEIAFPGEEPPTDDDLLTEATLPAELRGTQRRFTELDRFNVLLPPGGDFTLEGPDPEQLPSKLHGLHLVLLRIEVVDDKEGDSNLGTAGSGTGIVHSGGVAGFPIPPLRYYVGGGDGIGGETTLTLVAPADGAAVSRPDQLHFSWSAVAGAVLYRLEVTGASGPPVLEALLPRESITYVAPPWLAEQLPGPAFRWRVVALGAGGRRLVASAWQRGTITTRGETDSVPRSPPEQSVPSSKGDFQ